VEGIAFGCPREVEAAVAVDFREEIRDITAQLVEKYAPERIILFGSAARGDPHPDSDADFLIIKRECPPLGRDRVRELNRLIHRNIAVDFLVYRPDEFESRLAMGDPFLSAIVREGRVLHG
jgi:predicted nucleotidyltransferase